MEDKVFLDEAGLGEVGKVIKKHYVNKEDILELDSNLQALDSNLKDFKNITNEKLNPIKKSIEISNVIESVMVNYQISGLIERVALLSGKYENVGNLQFLFDLKNVLALSDNDKFILKMLMEDKIETSNRFNLLTIKVNDSLTSSSNKAILQVAIDPSTGVQFMRQTKSTKKEYSDEEILKALESEGLYILMDYVPDDDWHPWCLDAKGFNGLLTPVKPEGSMSGLMTPDDKKKLDSINVDAINSGNNSNSNTIKVCDVEKEVLSKGADAPVGFYIDSAQQGDGITIYRLYIDSIFRSKCYYRQEFSPDIRTSQTQGVKATWANGQWIKNLIKAPQVD